MTDFSKIMGDLTALVGESDGACPVPYYLKTSLPNINMAVSGDANLGFPGGRLIIVSGPESCVAGDTMISWQKHRASGSRRSKRKSEISDLYRRFHGNLTTREKANSNPLPGDFFTVASVTDDGCVFHNRIVDVVATGVKECFQIMTGCGEQIRATADHRFWTGTEYVELRDLEVGSIVMLHLKTTNRKDFVDRSNNRKYLFVKHHPVCGSKTIAAVSCRSTGEMRDYPYKRLARSRAVIEAQMNGLSMDAYAIRLNSNDLAGLSFLPRESHVHHLDENCLNDDLSNLQVISASDHGVGHSKERIANLSFIATEAKVSKIESVGEMETFDIKVIGPNNNFIANKFVVHNCGKTALATELMVQAQAMGGFAFVNDFEHAWWAPHAASIGLKVDPGDPYYYRKPNNAEEGFEIAYKVMRTLRAGELKLTLPKDSKEKATAAADTLRAAMRGKDLSKFMPIVGLMDSIASMIPQAQDIEYAKQNMKTKNMELAMMLSIELKRLARDADNSGTTMVLLNQLRTNPGVMFGDNQTEPGGASPRYYASLMIRLRRVNKWYATYGDKDSEVIGDVVEMFVRKNKTYRPFKKTRYVFRTVDPVGLDVVGTMIMLGKEAGVLGPKEGVTVEFDGKKKWNVSAFDKACREDEALKNRLITHVMAHVNPVEEGPMIEEEEESPEGAFVLPVV